MSGETPRWAITYRSRIGDLRLAIVNVCDVMVDRPNDTATIREKVQAVIDETDNLANRLSKVDDPKINPFIQELREAWNEATKAID